MRTRERGRNDSRSAFNRPPGSIDPGRLSENWQQIGHGGAAFDGYTAGVRKAGVMRYPGLARMTSGNRWAYYGVRFRPRTGLR